MPSSKNYSQGEDVIINETLHTRGEFYDAMARQVYPPDRPAPPNLDALTDLLREYHVTFVLCRHWELGDEDTAKISQVFTDLDIPLEC